ncbi:MAG: RNase adapter RapZ [Oscillospiraceae bacterium]|nr:RNase adapter RapZ [Oscillospiraceae bacterium]
MDHTNILIVTGMSGAGKTHVADALEDLGYYCVDNVPPALVQNFAELSKQSRGEFSKIAIVVDVRSREMFSDFKSCLDELKAQGYKLKILFLDCAGHVLICRYKQTRRTHPLISGEISSIEDAIKEERAMLAFAKSAADYDVDTSEASDAQLKSIVAQLFSNNGENTMTVSCVSFGFKHGLPPDADLLFDVRCLPNPFYVPELRDKTGLDEEVREYVLSSPQAAGLLPRLFGLIDYLVPLYVQEGKSHLVIVVGCTGGKHRSVVFAELIASHLSGQGIRAVTRHRHITLAN